MKNKIVYVTSYHYIDLLVCEYDTTRLTSFVSDEILPCTTRSAAEAFTKCGWEGDGRIGAIWVPPFVVTDNYSWGLFLWHVKQDCNGTSWLCAKHPYEFPGLPEEGGAWKNIEVNERIPRHRVPF